LTRLSSLTERIRIRQEQAMLPRPPQAQHRPTHTGSGGVYSSRDGDLETVRQAPSGRSYEWWKEEVEPQTRISHAVGAPFITLFQRRFERNLMPFLTLF